MLSGRDDRKADAYMRALDATQRAAMILVEGVFVGAGDLDVLRDAAEKLNAYAAEMER